MRKAEVHVHDIVAGVLTENDDGTFCFEYLPEYQGAAVSLTMPLSEGRFLYDNFPPFFDGLLPEGMMLEGLLRQQKIDENDLFSQLICVGGDLVGAVTVREIA